MATSALDARIERATKTVLLLRSELDRLADLRAAAIVGGSPVDDAAGGRYGELVMRWSTAVDELDALLIAEEARRSSRIFRSVPGRCPAEPSLG